MANREHLKVWKQRVQANPKRQTRHALGLAITDQVVTIEGEVAAIPNVDPPPTPAPVAPAPPRNIQATSQIARLTIRRNPSCISISSI